jgi:hypothetical protein
MTLSPAVMHLILFLSLGHLGFARFVQQDAPLTARATPTIHVRGEEAIIPTTSGQIGINPVESDLGNAETYIGEIYGTDTQYITVDPDQGTTKVSLHKSKNSLAPLKTISGSE